MTGNLEAALRTLLQTALPDLFGGATPAVQISFSGQTFDVDPDSADLDASAPRPDDRTDTFPFDANNPAGPYTLTQPPYPGPRRVSLVLTQGDRLFLRDQEVLWDETDARVFSLNLRPNRELANVTGIQVLYGVTSIFTKLKLIQRLVLDLQASDTATLDRAEALVAAVIVLNRPALIDAAQVVYENGDYGAVIAINTLTLLQGMQATDNTRQLTLQAEPN